MNSRIVWASRSVFASSRAASTSSSRQNGLGLLRKIASNSATAVSVFSPPLMSERPRSSLPGGRATMSTPGFEHVVRVIQHDVGHAAAEELAEQFLEVARTAS